MGKIILNGIEYTGGEADNVFAPVIYSDTERVIGVWRDNKPLYQKTLIFTGSYSGSATNLPINISNLDTVFLVDSWGLNQASAICPLPYVNNQTQYLGGVFISADKTTIGLRFGTSISFTKLVFTLRYTKTTDVAGSGDYNTYGVPTVHYSTNEQVIGTWTDGKPLYERVFDNLSIALNNDNWVYFNDPTYIDNVISLDAYSLNSDRHLHCAISEYQRSNTNGIMFSGFSGFNRTVNRIIARYTKTTD